MIEEANKATGEKDEEVREHEPQAEETPSKGESPLEKDSDEASDPTDFDIPMSSMEISDHEVADGDPEEERMKEDFVDE
ncbi:hypothetical protein Dimus_026522, partial [Dionaea muscipula]